MDDSSVSFQELKMDSNIWYKIHVLLYDLRHFDESNFSRFRLETVIDPSYLGEPYFNPDEAEKIKGARLEGDRTMAALIEETLNERLERRIKKRVESGDYRVCAAHDVAPILEKALGIKPKDLERNKAFLDTMSANGLHLMPDEQWTGLGKQQKNLHNKSGKKKGKKRQAASLSRRTFRNYGTNIVLERRWQRAWGDRQDCWHISMTSLKNSNDEVCGGDKDVIRSRGKRFEAKEEKTEDVMDVNGSGNMTLRGT